MKPLKLNKEVKLNYFFFDKAFEQGGMVEHQVALLPHSYKFPWFDPELGL